MRRGEIYWVDLDPTVSDEIKKVRPVLIVSNNANNRMADTVTVVPITSNTTKVYPFEVFLDAKVTGLSKHSKAQCHQVRTISKKRMKHIKAIGLVRDTFMLKINVALQLHLDLATHG